MVEGENVFAAKTIQKNTPINNKTPVILRAKARQVGAPTRL